MVNFSKLTSIILSTLNGNDNKKSSTRFQSYIVLIPVILTAFVFIFIEIINAIITWKTGAKYIPTNEILVAYGMILTHHISVLFSRQKSKDNVEYTENNVTETDPETNLIQKTESTVINTNTDSNNPITEEIK